MRSPTGKGLSIREITLFGILGALTFGAKFVMSYLPNIEPVSLMIMLFAVTFGKKCIYPTYVYVAMEILVYGISTWNIYYLYVWLILAVLALAMRSVKGRLPWAVLSGAFGLAFGALCGVTDIFLYGYATAVAKWLSGIPYDLLHCVGNFVIALLLFDPLRQQMEKLYKKL